MAKQIGNSPFLYDDNGAKVIGAQNPDGSTSGVIVPVDTIADIPATPGTYKVGSQVYVVDGGVKRKTQAQKKRSFITTPGNINFQPINAGSSGNTIHAIHSSPVKYIGCRIGVMHVGGVDAVTGIAVSIAASDDVGSRNRTELSAGTGTARRGMTPKRSGTTYNSITTGVDPGWKQVTFSGSASLSIADPGAGAVSIAWSDYIPMDSYYDADNGFYPLLTRFDYVTGADGTRATIYGSALTGEDVGTNLKDDIPGYSYLSVHRNGNFGCAATPSNWTDSSNVGGAFHAPLFIEYYTEEDIGNILFCGDSRFSVSSEYSATKQYLGTANLLRAAIYNSGKKYLLNNLAFSGETTLQYYTRAVEVMKRDKPDVIFYLISSINDGSISASIQKTQLTQAESILNLAKAYGGTVVFLTGFPANATYTSAQLALMNNIISWANANGDGCIDVFNIYGSGNTANTWDSGVNFDANHMNNAYYQDLANRMLAFL